MHRPFCDLRRYAGYALAAVALCASTARPARAQLDFTLLTPDVTARRAGMVTFQALLTNNAGIPLFLNNDLGLVDIPLLLDDLPFQTQFLLPTPQPTLPADNLPHVYDLFTVNLPADPSLYVGLPSVFSGSFTLYGGATDADQTELGRQEFTITLAPGSAAPEPGTLALFALGIVGMSAMSAISGANLARRRARR